MKSRIRVVCLFSFLFTLLLFNIGRSDLLFDQTASGYSMAYRCQWDSVNNQDARIADNFIVPYPANVDSLVWWGGYWPGNIANILDFWIEIYPDSIGFNQPQQEPIYSQRVGFTETSLAPPPNYYIYEAIIPPFQADSGVTYWMQFMPTLVFPPNYWGNNGSISWGDGQECYFKSEYFGYPLWIPATTIFGSPIETSFQIYGTAAGIEEKEDQKHEIRDLRLTAFPNPFTTATTIHLTSIGHSAEGVELKIYDSSGRLIRSFPSSLLSLRSSVTWDGRDNSGRSAPAGVYFLKIKAGDNQTTKKLLKIK